MDINNANRADWDRRRKIRLAQVRDQSKILAKTIRDRVLGADEVQLEKHKTARCNTEHKFKSLALSKLKSDFNYLIQDVGNGYVVASIQPDPSIVLAEKRLINRCTAISRGIEAEKQQQRIQEEHQMDKEMREKRTHFNKTIEKIRSKLITSLPNVDSSYNRVLSDTKQNECFLIPSQVVLNESDIKNWNYNKKTSKPWSVDLNSNHENRMTKMYQATTKYDDNKENELNITKLETDMKNYETLVCKLKKLSAEEQNIRDKLFTYNRKEDPVLYKNRVPSVTQENNKQTEMTKDQHVDKNTNLNKRNNEVIGKTLESNSNSSAYISSSTSTNINDQCPVKSFKKTIHFKNIEAEKNTLPSNSKQNYKKKKFTTENPLKNINNTVQRIKKKKQLLVNEISAGSKEIKEKSSMSPIHIRCKAGNDLHKVSPTNYATLPDSFYDCQLDRLKKQISMKNSKPNDSKCNEIINADLMQYINTLLKMTPSDIDDLSISSCSSIKLEESILQYSTKNKQHYSEILNCISKCLNIDISDLSQETTFDSPKNINILNRLHKLTNYYLDKTHEMKNICDESSPIMKDQNTEAEIKIIKEDSSINLSPDSSVDGDYILSHLNTILQRKGLIRCGEEWPMFENRTEDDDNRSLTDQLLDVQPHRSDES